ncbi:MAG: hypothetical protein AB1807_10205 [Pseudomonadota bacterium]
MPSLRTGILFAATLVGAAAPAHAARVQEVRMQNLAAYLAKHETVVVQFTSPDPKCRYCIGADRLFDQAVTPARDPKVKYVRVQWPVWHKFPDFGSIQKPIGLPDHIVFQRGRAIGTIAGRQDQPEGFLAKVAEVRANPKDPKDFYRQEQPTVPAPASPATPAAPMSAEEARLTRLMARKDLLGGIVGFCASTFPAAAPAMQDAYTAWQAAHKTGLDKAAVVMLTRTSRSDAGAASALVRDEQERLQAWTVGSLGIAQDRKPSAADCEKIGRNLNTLPEIDA